MKDKQIIIVGASARAAAQSAQRAGYAVYWLDQFGDMDVRAIAPGQLVPSAEYPGALIELISNTPDAPFLYTGAVENYTDVLATLEQTRELLGNSGHVCQKLQNHKRISEVIADNQLPVARVVDSDSTLTQTGKWLEKAILGSGGSGIREYYGQNDGINSYLQEFIDGESRSAVFISNGKQCVLLGVSKQLVGLTELYADKYSYCGSVGPVAVAEAERNNWQKLAELLVNEFSITGLFGIDAIVVNDSVYLVEINPRYTASVEVYELAYGMSTIELHEQACRGKPLFVQELQSKKTVAKGYLFAPCDLFMPDTNSMYAELGFDAGIRFADIPVTGHRIMAGHPMMTVLISQPDKEAAYACLLDTAAKIYKYCR